ncbi:hypothetical protein MMC25_002728 [Agyrium rufum]|nr:hypothetical protein [Agyrium rufum]
MKSSFHLVLVTSLCWKIASSFPLVPQEALQDGPVVDLGYAMHKGSKLQENPSYYNFSNIRYAAPSIGALRFSAPAPPPNNRSAGVQDGSYGSICPQAIPAWSNKTQANLPPGQFESEDCLFLDVIVPNTTFQADQGVQMGKAPVFVWFYGGGYVMGSRLSIASPVGLLERSKEHSQGAIFVNMNYRLGAFGFLSGPTFQSNGTANAGLLDQRAALQWVRSYIHLFGGDPNRVTAIGESAGGGGILSQLTAYGGALGDGSSLMQQAVLQSPSIHNPTASKYQEELVFQKFLEYANVSTLEEARALDSQTLQMANKRVVREGPFGLFTFQPTVDGNFVTDIPSVALLTGAYDHAPSLLLAHNFNEGYYYTDPNATSSSNFSDYMSIYLPAAAATVINELSTTLYPPTYDSSVPVSQTFSYSSSSTPAYANPFVRLNLAVSELMIECNPSFLAGAKQGQTFVYTFNGSSGYHGSDVAYTFYDEFNLAGAVKGNPGVKNADAALTMQRWITAFAATGTPNGFALSSSTSGQQLGREIQGMGDTGMQGGWDQEFPIYGDESTVLIVTDQGVTRGRDAADNERCRWWQKGLYT